MSLRLDVEVVLTTNVGELPAGIHGVVRQPSWVHISDRSQSVSLVAFADGSQQLIYDKNLKEVYPDRPTYAARSAGADLPVSPGTPSSPAERR